MVNYRIDVIIDPSRAKTGSKKVRDELDKTENAADKLRGTLKRAFAGIGAALIIRELGQMADAYTNLQNRVRTVTEGQQELDSVTRELFQIANDTRGAFDATAEVYARTALAVKDLGIEQQQVLEFTKSLNQAVILSGAGAQEARAGMIQLSQGLASGALRGDELRSVLEQLPVVADVIAKSLGVTRGELRELGTQGKITSDIILTAFAEAREELDERFGKSVPTLGQSFQVLKNNLVEYIGAADQATGASALLSGVIIFAGENVEFLITGLTILAVSALPAAVSGMSALIASSAALSSVFSLALFNPVILGAAAAAAATLALVDVYENQLQVAVRETAAEMDRFLRTAAGSDLQQLDRAISNVEKTLQRVQQAVADGIVDPSQVAGNIDSLNAKLDELGQEWLALSDGSGRTLSQIREQKTAFDELSASVDDVADSIVAQAEATLQTDRALERRKVLLQEIASIEKAQGSAVTPDQRKQLELAVAQAQALDDQRRALNDIKGPQEAYEAQVAALNALNEEGKISTDEYAAAIAKLVTSSEGFDPDEFDFGGFDFTDIDTSALDTLLAQIQALQDTNQAEPLEDMNMMLAQVTMNADKYADSLGRIGVAAEEANTASAGFAAGLQTGMERITDVSGAAADAMVNAFQSAENAMTDSTVAAFGFLAKNLTDSETSWVEYREAIQASFKQAIDSVLSDLARLAVRKAILSTIPGMQGFADGGEFSGGAPILVGEEGPEIITPKGSGEVIPAGETAARMAKSGQPMVNVAPPQVSVPITNVVQGDISSDLESPEGEEGVLNIIHRNPGAVRQA